MKRILILLTGGTICSTVNPQSGKSQSHAESTKSLLELDFKKSDSPEADKVAFEYRFLPTDILSENMTFDVWEQILFVLREPGIKSGCDGVIILHGTDTLAFTASFLALGFAGYPIPILMVSAQLSLDREKTNGYANFRAAVELIAGGIAPNVYAVYRNVKGKDHDPDGMLLHYGSHLLQCPNGSDSFHSRDELVVPDEKCARLTGNASKGEPIAYKIKGICPSVLLLSPYVNLCYDRIPLDGVCAIVHGTYHSESVCIGRALSSITDKDKLLTLSEVRESDRPYSILTLLWRAEREGIPVFLAPCDKEGSKYGTTANAIEQGAVPIPSITSESAYAKAVLGCSLGLRGKELCEFMAKEINGELENKA